MRPPSRWLAPGAGTAMPPPLRPSGGGARGPEAPPHSPPPPTQAHERTEARNGGPAPPQKRLLHPGCGGTTAEAGAHTPRPLPADGGLAAPRMAQTERPYQRPARGRRGREPARGGSPPPDPSPPPAPHWPIGGRPARTRRPQPPVEPPRHEYTPGGHAGDSGLQADARRGGGAGGRPPHPSPPAPPPQLGSHRSGPPPPPPPEGTATRGGGMRLDLHTARPSAPIRLLSRGSRPQGEPTPACRSNARTKLGGGARRRTRTVSRPRPT